MSDFAKIISDLRALDANEFKTIRKWIDTLSDDQAACKLFYNYRKNQNSADGVRLTIFGAGILKSVYHYWEVPLIKPLTMGQMLTLSRACRLPFYTDSKRVGCFETDVGTILCLIQGNISSLENVL